MTARVILHVEIDDEKPLGPQIAAARAQHVPWKVLAAALGMKRQMLERYLQRAADDRACQCARLHLCN